MSAKPDHWIIAHDGTKGRDAYALECLRCGTVRRFDYNPIPVLAWCTQAKTFSRKHEKCKEQEPHD